MLQSLAGLLALVLALGWGWLADRAGYGRLVPVVFVGSGVLLGVLAGMGSVATVATVYLMYAAVQCEVMTLVVMYLVAVVPEGVRGAALGLQNSAQQLGNAVGPVVGGAVAMGAGVRFSLWVSGVLLGVCWLGFVGARWWGRGASTGVRVV
ncbi:MFS transporter [Stackebrandtia nassauensis]|uniref:MFS transporter n=1 Tax=Stackebrandtia nassauensis TaxID=283811 RepID=UPI003CC78954